MYGVAPTEGRRRRLPPLLDHVFASLRPRVESFVVVVGSRGERIEAHSREERADIGRAEGRL